MDEKTENAFGTSATENNAYSTTNSTTHGVTINYNEAPSRPGWSDKHCGSWYAVPIVAM